MLKIVGISFFSMLKLKLIEKNRIPGPHLGSQVVFAWNCSSNFYFQMLKKIFQSFNFSCKDLLFFSAIECYKQIFKKFWKFLGENHNWKKHSNFEKIFKISKRFQIFKKFSNVEKSLLKFQFEFWRFIVFFSDQEL